MWFRQEDAGAKPDAAAQGRGGVKGLGKKGNQHAARLAAEARQALAVSKKQTPFKNVALGVFPLFFFFLRDWLVSPSVLHYGPVVHVVAIPSPTQPCFLPYEGLRCIDDELFVVICFHSIFVPGR